MSKYLLLLLIIFSFTSCKDKETIAEIFVKNGNNQALQGVKVMLVGDINHDPANDPPLNIADSATTDQEGKVVFNFTDKIKPGQTGFVIVDVILSNNDDVIIDKMIIKQEEFNSETFYFTP